MLSYRSLGYTGESVFFRVPASLFLYPLSPSSHSNPHPSLLGGFLHALNPDAISSFTGMYKWLIDSTVSHGAVCIWTTMTWKGYNYNVKFRLLLNPWGSITRAVEPPSSLKSPPDNFPYLGRRLAEIPVFSWAPCNQMAPYGTCTHWAIIEYLLCSQEQRPDLIILISLDPSTALFPTE